MRKTLAWYPDDVWLWLLACQWRRLDQEEAFVGRTAEVGDKLGSRILTARIVRDLMRLCFLLERRYAPYGKWLGTAFARLEAHRDVGPPLHSALEAADYPAREAALTAAARAVAERQNALGVTNPSTRPSACSTNVRTACSARAGSSRRASSASRIPGCARCLSSVESTSSSIRPTPSKALRCSAERLALYSRRRLSSARFGARRVWNVQGNERKGTSWPSRSSAARRSRSSRPTWSRRWS